MNSNSNKGEIRGLKSGIYYADKEKTRLIVNRSDDEISIDLVDDEAGIFYHFGLSDKNVKFEFGDPYKPEQ